MALVLEGLNLLPTICGQQSNFDTALCIDRWGLNLIKSQFTRVGVEECGGTYIPSFLLFTSVPQFSPKLHRSKGQTAQRLIFLTDFGPPPSLFDNCYLSELHYSLHFHYRWYWVELNDWSNEEWLWLWMFSFCGGLTEEWKQKTLTYQAKYTISEVRLILTRLAMQCFEIYRHIHKKCFHTEETVWQSKKCWES